MMKRFISLLLIVAILCVYAILPVFAAPAVAGVGIMGALLAFMSYYGISTVAGTGTTSFDLESGLEQALSDYAVYKASSIADLFPAGDIVYSLGRVILNEDVANRFAEFVDWYAGDTASVEGAPISKPIYQTSSLSFGDTPLPVCGVDYALSTYKGNTVNVFPIPTNNGPTNNVGQALNSMVTPSYWFWGLWPDYNSYAYICVTTSSANTGISLVCTSEGGSLYDRPANQSFVIQDAAFQVKHIGNYYFTYCYPWSAYPQMDSVVKIEASLNTVAGALVQDTTDIVITGVPTYPTENDEPAIDGDVVIGVEGMPLDLVEDKAGEYIIQSVIEGGLVTTEAMQEVVTPSPELGIGGLSDKFPFSLPFDLYYAVSLLRAEPLPPSFTLPLYIPSVGNYDLDIDLTDFDSVASVLRTMEVILFCVGLAIITNKVVR